MTILQAPQTLGRVLGRFKDNVTHHVSGSGTVALTPQESWELYDSKARELLGMSAEDFERGWKRGDFNGRQEDRRVRQVIMLRTKKP